MNFDFEFSEILVSQIDLFESVLRDLHKPDLNGNSDFVVDTESAGTFQLHVSVASFERNILPIDFHFEGDGLRIDIDNIPESFEWTQEDIENHGQEVASFIHRLFTCSTLIDSESEAIYMKLFDLRGTYKESLLVRSKGILGGLASNAPKTHLFQPLYPL